MTEVWFYHLQRQSLEVALPKLVEKAVARGWRVIVQTVDDLRLKALDDLLWTYAAESFLVHTTTKDPNPEGQPILLTCASDNPNDAAVRIYVEGAEVVLDPEPTYERVILIFDGRSDAELSAARVQWSALKGRGLKLAYWQQKDEGGWRQTA